jgi:hypothetical protein
MKISTSAIRQNPSQKMQKYFTSLEDSVKNFSQFAISEKNFVESSVAYEHEGLHINSSFN